jgi:Rrf2 family protein
VAFPTPPSTTRAAPAPAGASWTARRSGAFPFSLPYARRPADNGAGPSYSAGAGGAMRLTSACVYALRALVYLARHRKGGFVSVEEIAGAGAPSEGFLRKSLKPLASAGVLRSSRGPRGGYRLARPARSITLLEVVEAVEGPLRGFAPRLGGGGARLDARLQEVCEGAAEAVRRRLGKVSLADLVRQGKG